MFPCDLITFRAQTLADCFPVLCGFQNGCMFPQMGQRLHTRGKDKKVFFKNTAMFVILIAQSFSHWILTFHMPKLLWKKAMKLQCFPVATKKWQWPRNSWRLHVQNYAPYINTLQKSQHRAVAAAVVKKTWKLNLIEMTTALQHFWWTLCIKLAGKRHAGKKLAGMHLATDATTTPTGWVRKDIPTLFSIQWFFPCSSELLASPVGKDLPTNRIQHSKKNWFWKNNVCSKLTMKSRSVCRINQMSSFWNFVGFNCWFSFKASGVIQDGQFFSVQFSCGNFWWI